MITIDAQEFIDGFDGFKLCVSLSPGDPDASTFDTLNDALDAAHKLSAENPTPEPKTIFIYPVEDINK